MKYRLMPIADMAASVSRHLADGVGRQAAGQHRGKHPGPLRGVLLMAMSNKTGKLVLTTGNKSEMAVGYSTLYGDMAGGFAVIKDVPKTMVYRCPATATACRR